MARQKEPQRFALGYLRNGTKYSKTVGMGKDSHQIQEVMSEDLLQLQTDTTFGAGVSGSSVVAKRCNPVLGGSIH